MSLRGIKTTILWLIPFIAWIVTHETLYPYIMGKATFFRLAITFFSVVLIAEYLLSSSFKWRPVFQQPFTVAKFFSLPVVTTTLLVWIFFTSLFSPDFSLSFWSNYARMEGWISYFFLSLWGLYLYQSLDKKKTSWFLLSWWLLAVVILTTAVLQVFRLAAAVDPLRVDSVFGNSAYLGFFSSLLFFFFWIFLDDLRNSQPLGPSIVKKILNYLTYFLALLSIGCLFWSQSRAGILAVILGSVLYLFFQIRQKAFNKWQWIAGFSLLSVVSALSLLFSRPEKNLIQRFFENGLSDPSLQARASIWQMCWAAFVEKPWLGWGQESMQFLSRFYEPQLWINPWFDRAHNFIFEWLVSAGVIGLFLFMTFWILIFKKLLQKRKQISSLKFFGLLGFFLAYFLNISFVFDFLPAQIFVIFLIVYLWAGDNEQLQDQKATKVRSRALQITFRLISVPVLMGLVALSYDIVVRPYIRSAELKKFVLPMNPLDHVKLKEDFAEAQRILLDVESFYSFLGQYEAHQMTLDKMNYLASQKNQWSPEIAATIRNFYEWYTSLLESKIKKLPDFIFYKVTLASLYSQYQDYDRARVLYENLMQQYPRHQFVLVDYGSWYLSQGKVDNALQMYEKSLEYDQNFILGRQFRTILYIYSGQIERVIVELDWLRKHSMGSQFDDRIVGALAQTQQKQLLQQLMAERTEYYERLRQKKFLIQELFK